MAPDGPCEPLSVGPSAPNFQEGRIQSRWGRDPRALFTLRASRRGGHELRTSVYPSPSAPIATKLRQRAFQTICKFRFFDAEKKVRTQFQFFFSGFSLFSVVFRGARFFLTSKSNSSRFFALDGQIFRSVRPLGLIFRFFTVRTSSCGGKAPVTEIPEGAKPPRPTPGGKARVTEIPEGGKAPPDPPTTPFQKICPSGANFWK